MMYQNKAPDVTNTRANNRIVLKAPFRTKATSNVNAIDVSSTMVVILRFSSNMISNCFFGPIRNMELSMVRNGWYLPA